MFQIAMTQDIITDEAIEVEVNRSEYDRDSLVSGSKQAGQNMA